jgi:HPt (histidine-containing phosphotransfer) domain-containing protein
LFFIDREKIAAELGINVDLYNEILLDFRRQSEERLGELEKSFKARNAEGVKRAAHFLKGSSGNLRLQEIFAVASRIDRAMADNKDLASIAADIPQLKAALLEFRKFIGR